MKKMWCTHATEHDSLGTLQCATARMNTENTVLRGISQSGKGKYCMFSQNSPTHSRKEWNGDGQGLCGEDSGALLISIHQTSGLQGE